MAKKAPKKNPEEKVEEYYDLKTQAVDDLVNADESNSPPVSDEERKRYGANVKTGIPRVVKLCFIKFWFPAAVCYFFFWGLGTYVSYMLDLLVAAAVALGIVTDLLTNNVLRFLASTEGENDAWMMFPKKRFITFFLNILYSAVLLAMVVAMYAGVNAVARAVTGASADSTVIGIEPILFGLFYLISDSLLLGLKHLLFRRA